MKGREIIVKTAKACGIKYLFYVPGGMTTLFDEFAKEEGINMVLCRSELGAANMAHGYSRVTNEPSIAYGQYGTAAALIGAVIYESQYAHSPVVALTGATPTYQKDMWMYQELYEMPYFDYSTKYNVDVTDIERLGDYLRVAIQESVSGCPGPTHVNVHVDMAELEADVPEPYEDLTFKAHPPFRPLASLDKIEEAARLLANAERPVLITGTGVHLSNAYDEVRELAEILSSPVATNVKGKGTFPENSPLYAGVMGSYGTSFTNEIVRKADVVFAIGVRFDPHMTESMTAPDPHKTRIIHLDIEPSVIGRVYRTDVGLLGDAKRTLIELISILKKVAKRQLDKSKFLALLSSKKHSHELLNREKYDSDDVPIKPQRLMKEIGEVLKEEDIVVSDTGLMQCWTTRFLNLKGVGLNYLPCGGTMGSSLSESLGAAFGAKEGQRVVELIGDGGMGYTIAELETAARYKDGIVPYVVVVNNNSGFSQVKPKFDRDTSKAYHGLPFADFTTIDFAKVAEGFGCKGLTVEKAGEIGEVVEECLNSGKPSVVNVISDGREYPPIRDWLSR